MGLAWNALGAEKEAVAARLLGRLEALFPGISSTVRMTDVATPLTFWSVARSWRGAYEGWQPNADGLFGHVSQTLSGLEAFYMAGQWVEPGGGVPTALASGRKAVQLICAADGRPFIASPAEIRGAPIHAQTGPDPTRPVLVLYATREGHTRRIAQHVAGALRAGGREADVRDVRTDPPRDLTRYGGVILAGSVHIQRHEPELVDFVREHRHALEQLPSAFLSVSLGAAGAEDPNVSPAVHERALDDVARMAHDFFERTGFRADLVRPVAGALAYTHYSPPLRVAMRMIAALKHGNTDTSKDHDFTDWKALDRFVTEFCEGR